MTHITDTDRFPCDEVFLGAIASFPAKVFPREVTRKWPPMLVNPLDRECLQCNKCQHSEALTITE